jgi:hypothetical protein
MQNVSQKVDAAVERKDGSHTHCRNGSLMDLDGYKPGI